MKKRTPISQADARRLQRRVQVLEALIAEERLLYSSKWPGGVHIASINEPPDGVRAAANTARVLGHAVVVTVESGTIKFFALPHPKVPA